MKIEKITPENSCLIVVDLQEKLMKAIHRSQEITAASTLLIASAKELGIQILPTTQYHKGLGGYLPEINKEIGEIPRFDKIEFSAAANPAIREYIDSLQKIDTFFLIGVETHICILQTALDLLAIGKKVWIIADAVSSRREELHKQGLSLLQQAGAIAAPAETVIYMLLHKAGTAEFKKILPLITAQ